MRLRIARSPAYGGKRVCRRLSNNTARSRRGIPAAPFYVGEFLHRKAFSGGAGHATRIARMRYMAAVESRKKIFVSVTVFRIVLFSSM